MVFAFVRDSGEVLSVTGKYFAPSRGRVNSMYVPEEPDEPADFEVDSIKDVGGREVDVTDEEFGAIVQAGIERCEEAWA